MSFQKISVLNTLGSLSVVNCLFFENHLGNKPIEETDFHLIVGLHSQVKWWAGPFAILLTYSSSLLFFLFDKHMHLSLKKLMYDTIIS
jgi:hypothetical protein